MALAALGSLPPGSPARPPGRPGRRRCELEKCLGEGRLTPFPTHNTLSRVPHSAPVHACVGRFTCVLSGQPPTVPRPHPLSIGKQVQRFRRCLRAVHLASAKLGFEPDLRLQSQDCLARGPCCWEHPKPPQLQSPPAPREPWEPSGVAWVDAGQEGRAGLCSLRTSPETAAPPGSLSAPLGAGGPDRGCALFSTGRPA